MSKLAIGILVGAFALPLTALASKLNPCLRALEYSNGELSQGSMNWYNACGWRPVPERFKLAVHEHMTLLAMDTYRMGRPRWNPMRKGMQRFEYMLDLKPWSKPGEKVRHLTWALMFGTWWNDDPLMSTWGEGTDISNGLWRLYTTITKEQTHYPGGVATCRGIKDFVPADMNLARQSHYGAMQHLHFMTNLPTPAQDSEEARLKRVEDTRGKALQWMQFAYSVATQAPQSTPTAYLSPQRVADLGMPSIAANHCVTDSDNVKIRTLFARLGLDNALRDQITPDVALGSMLHVIQDSFSPSHTCRVAVVHGPTQSAVLKDVMNYREQVESDHAKLDAYPQWLRRVARGEGHTFDNDPVVVGSWLIGAVDRRLPWDTVRTYLESTAFATLNSNVENSKMACIGLGEASN